MYEGAHGRWLSRSGCGSDALLDEIAIGRGPEADADPEERVEGRPHVPSSVPSEHELVQVSLIHDACGGRGMCLSPTV